MIPVRDERLREDVERADPASTRLADRWPVRLAGIALLTAVIYIHLRDVGDKFEEVPYLGEGYVVMMVGCAIAIVLLLMPDRVDHIRGWMLGGGLAAATLLGFVLTRTVGLPHATGDIGNWHETLGVWSLITEGLLVIVAAACSATAREPATTSR